jgi:hypothetical protein
MNEWDAITHGIPFVFNFLKIYSYYLNPKAKPTALTINAQIHATVHCPTIIKAADLPPSSLFTEAIAATHGV